MRLRRRTLVRVPSSLRDIPARVIRDDEGCSVPMKNLLEIFINEKNHFIFENKTKFITTRRESHSLLALGQQTARLLSRATYNHGTEVHRRAV